MKRESMPTILVVLIIAVAVFGISGYFKGGLTGFFTRVCMLSGIILLLRGIYFQGVRFLRNQIDSLLIGLVLSGEPEISEVKPTEIREKVKTLRKSIERIRTVFHHKEEP